MGTSCGVVCCFYDGFKHFNLDENIHIVKGILHKHKHKTIHEAYRECVI